METHHAEPVPTRVHWPINHKGNPCADRLAKEPEVSCLCVTEHRHAFMPWLLWNYDRQHWRRKELVVVDSSDPPVKLPQRRDVRVLHVEPGTPLGAKRNVALRMARGEVIAWFDDDDWQHPERLSTLVPLLRHYAIRARASFIGPSESYFLDISGQRCKSYRTHRYAIFNGTVFYRDMVADTLFDETLLRTEDTKWIAALLRRCRGFALRPTHPFFLWLCHHSNVTNTLKRRKLDLDASKVIQTLSWGWGDTFRQLALLRHRLANQAGVQTRNPETKGVEHGNHPKL